MLNPLLIAGLGNGLVAVFTKLLEKGIIDPALTKGLEPFTGWLTHGYDDAKGQQSLQKAFAQALKHIGAPVEDEDEWLAWAEQTGVDHLLAPNAHDLRQQVATRRIGGGFALAIHATCVDNICFWIGD